MLPSGSYNLLIRSMFLEIGFSKVAITKFEPASVTKLFEFLN